MFIVASNVSRGIVVWGLAGVLAGAIGCASAIPPVRMYADQQDLATLVGRWSGEYIGDTVGTRRGTVFFELVRGEDHAHGDVTMTPEGSDQPYTQYEPGTVPSNGADRATVQFLSIQFVEVGDGIVNGVLDAYWDPDRRTQASSTFRGRVSDNLIEGTYVTTYRNGDPQTTGRWMARREP